MVGRKRRGFGKFSGMPKDPWFKKRMGDDDWGIVPINYKGCLLFAILILINIFNYSCIIYFNRRVFLYH